MDGGTDLLGGKLTLPLLVGLERARGTDRRRLERILTQWQPELMGDGTGILVVDDLVDTGKTLELVRRLYPKAHFATVYAKPSGRPMVDTYITEVSQDTWIFFPWDMALQYVEPYRGRD